MFDYYDICMFDKFNAESEARENIRKAIKSFRYFKYRRLNIDFFNVHLTIFDFLKDVKSVRNGTFAF